MKAARQLGDVILRQLTFHCACTAPAASLTFAKQERRVINSRAVHRSQSLGVLGRGQRSNGCPDPRRWRPRWSGADCRRPRLHRVTQPRPQHLD